MFAEELADLKDRYPDRLQIVHVLSREPQLSALLSGRLDADRMRAILDHGLVDAGPASTSGSSVDRTGWSSTSAGVLAERGVPDACVHTELFHVEDEPAPPRPGRGRRAGRRRHRP